MHSLAVVSRRSARLNSKNISVNSCSAILSASRRSACRSATVSSFSSSSFRCFSTSKPVFFDFSTMSDMQVKACEIYKDNKLFGTRTQDQYNWMTYAEFGEIVQTCRKVLAQHNIAKGTGVAIISNNRYEWAATSYAAMSLGAPVIPMYEQQLETDWKYIVNDSDAQLLVVATEAIYERVQSYPGTIGKVKHVLCMNAAEDKPYSFHGWMKRMKGEAPLPKSDVAPSDVAMIIYTSGTTGNPKGVELTNSNLKSVVTGGHHIFGSYLNASNRSLAFLPWAHVYGMSSELNSFIYHGSSLAIVPTRDQILEGIALAQPNIIVSVPALFNRIYDAVHKNLRAESPLKQKVVAHALAVARARNHELEYGRAPGFLQEKYFQLMDKVILSKIRAKFGKLQYFFAGGAATSLPVLHFFEDVGIPILEGYGLTETSPIITASGPDWSHRRLGCVGTPIKGCTVRIADAEGNEVPHGTDGEVTCAGPNVMLRYRHNEKATAEVFFQSGGQTYFRTGDMGRIVDGKFLKITGRIKEQFKLENGKYVVPAGIEDAYCRSPYFLQAFVYGDNRPFTVLLLALDFLELKTWIVKQAASDSSLATLLPVLERCSHNPKDPLVAPLCAEDVATVAAHPAVSALITAEMARIAPEVKSYERPEKFAVVSAPFSQDNLMLTPKMSLKRNNILKHYMPLIEALYSSKKE